MQIFQYVMDEMIDTGVFRSGGVGKKTIGESEECLMILERFRKRFSHGGEQG